MLVFTQELANLSRKRKSLGILAQHTTDTLKFCLLCAREEQGLIEELFEVFKLCSLSPLQEDCLKTESQSQEREGYSWVCGLNLLSNNVCLYITV